MCNQVQNNESQEEFFQNVIAQKRLVNVYLLNGVKLFGEIEAHDPHTITLSNNKAPNTEAQLVYKHAISTIQLNAG